MPNDAKLGLVLGVAIVLVIGLLFFRGDSMAAGASGGAVRAAASGNHDVAPPVATLVTNNWPESFPPINRP